MQLTTPNFGTENLQVGLRHLVKLQCGAANRYLNQEAVLLRQVANPEYSCVSVLDTS